MTTDSTEHVSEATGTDESERLDRLETKLDALADAVSKLIPGSRAEAEEQTEKRLDRGSAMEDQVRAELAKAKREEAETAQREQAESAHRAEHEAMAQMRENPPAPPRIRRTVMLGWGDGRK